MLNARVIAVKELLIPLQGPRAGLQAGAVNALISSLTASTRLSIDCPSRGERNETIAATHTFSVDGRDPLSSMIQNLHLSLYLSLLPLLACTYLNNA